MTNLASARRERAPSSAAVRSRKSRELPQLAGYQGWTRSRGQPGHLLVVVASRRSDGLRLVLLLGCRGRRWLLRPGTRRRIWAHGICGSGARRRRQRQPRGERHQRRVLCSGGAVRPSTDACLAEDELHLMQQWGTLLCDVQKAVTVAIVAAACKSAAYQRAICFHGKQADRLAGWLRKVSHGTCSPLTLGALTHGLAEQSGQGAGARGRRAGWHAHRLRRWPRPRLLRRRQLHRRQLSAGGEGVVRLRVEGFRGFQCKESCQWRSPEPQGDLVHSADGAAWHRSSSWHSSS